MLSSHGCDSCHVWNLLWLSFYLAAENPGQGRPWTPSVSSSTLQQLRSQGRRRRRKLAKCRWVWGQTQDVRAFRKSGALEVRTVLAFAGDSGRSNHQRQPPTGGLWQRQDREERQLLSLCESLALPFHVNISTDTSGRVVSTSLPSVRSVAKENICLPMNVYKKSSFAFLRENSSGSILAQQANWLLQILKHVS